MQYDIWAHVLGTHIVIVLWNYIRFFSLDIQHNKKTLYFIYLSEMLVITAERRKNRLRFKFKFYF